MPNNPHGRCSLYSVLCTLVSFCCKITTHFPSLQTDFINEEIDKSYSVVSVACLQISILAEHSIKTAVVR